MIAYRSVDARFPFLWEGSGQPLGRWNDRGDGPIQYLSDTPDGAWAEFLRHEEIHEPLELTGVARAIWAIRIEQEGRLVEPELSRAAMTGGTGTYRSCRKEARRLRESGAKGLVAPSAALKKGAAGGWKVDGGLQAAPPADGNTIALFGERPDLVGWSVADRSAPGEHLFGNVRHL